MEWILVNWIHIFTLAIHGRNKIYRIVGSPAVIMRSDCLSAVLSGTALDALGVCGMHERALTAAGATFTIRLPSRTLRDLSTRFK